MSSVRKKDQTPHRFTVLDLVLDVYDHTTTLLANEKVFDPKYQTLINRIDNAASMAYHCCRAANEDYDNRDKNEAKIRLRLEAEAIEHCQWLKTDIRLAQRKFKLRAKKVNYWNEKVNMALAAIKSWHATEKRTYKKTHGM